MTNESTPGYLRVPARFWHDHADRAPYDDGVQPVRAIEVNARFATLRRDDPSLEHFYRDAMYYADPENMDDCPRSVRDSPQRTLAAFDGAGLVYPRHFMKNFK